jgi:predicted nucleic acid-binding protein
MYLLDTNVISELRRPKPHGAVLAWIKSVDSNDLRISAVTIGEIQEGIELTREHDMTKALELEDWLDRIAESYEIISPDARAFRLTAKLMHKRSGELYEDAMIAAIANIHSLTIVTRNTRDFVHFGIRTLNPFELAE